MAVGDAAFSQGDIMRRLAMLEDEVRQLRAARRLESATIGDGGLRIKGGTITVQNDGSIVVEDGGDIIMQGNGRLLMTSPDDVDLVDIGPDATGRQAFYLRRHNGALLMWTSQHANTGRDFWALSDNANNTIVADDAESGVGLARPWLPVPMVLKFHPDGVAGDPYAYATIDASKIGSETQLWDGRAAISHPKITVDGVWGRGSGDVAMTYRLKIGGTTVGTWSETGLVIAQRGPFDVSSLVGTDWASIEITAVATSGTGAVACQVLATYLHQS